MLRHGTVSGAVNRKNDVLRPKTNKNSKILTQAFRTLRDNHLYDDDGSQVRKRHTNTSDERDSRNKCGRDHCCDDGNETTVMQLSDEERGASI